jgi:hypothetical protein
MACLGSTGAIRTAPTAAIEVLLGLHPLHLQVEVEAKADNYRLRCNDQWKPKSEGFGHANMTLDMKKEPILQMWSDKMIPSHVYDKPFMIRFPDRSEWKERFHPDRKGRLIWYTDVSKTIKALELGCIAMVQGKTLVLTLGSTQQYSRQKQKCKPLRHVQLKIYESIGTIKTETSTFCQTVKLQLKHLANTRSLQKWSGIAINPSYY